MTTASTQDDAERALAARLLTAPSEAERRALLAGTGGGTLGLVKAVMALARDLRTQGDFRQSITGYALAQGIAEQCGEATWAARALHNIGVNHDAQGRSDLAAVFFERSLTRCEQAQDRPGIAREHNSLGIVYEYKGEYRRSLRHLHRSLTLKQEETAEDEEGRRELNDAIGKTLLNIGVVLHRQGDIDQALDFFKRSQSYAREARDEEVLADSVNNIGAIHEVRGEYVQALSCYAESLQMCEAQNDKRGYVQTLINIGVVLCDQGDYAGGLAHFQDALARCQAIDVEPITAEALPRIAEIHLRRGDYKDALDCATRMAEIAADTGSQRLLSEARHIEGEAHRGLGALKEARTALERSVGIIESLREQLEGGEQEKRHFFEMQSAPFHALVDLLIVEGEAFQALAYAERAKARVLLDVLQSGRRDVTKAMTVQEQEQEQQLRQELRFCRDQVQEADPTERTGLIARLAAVRREYEAFRMRLYTSHPDLKVQRGETAPLTEADLKALLPDEETALLEYVVMEEQTYLFAITHGTLEKIPREPISLMVFPIAISRTELEERVKAFRERLTAGLGGFPILARDLYDLLLRPAQECLGLSPVEGVGNREPSSDEECKKKLIIVPDGPLWDLPFQALQTEPHRYLLDDCALSMAGSLTVLREMNRLQRSPARRSPSRTLFAVGNPQHPGYPSLPETEEQVREIARLYGKDQSRVYVGPEATEEKVKAEAGDFRILHLAAHAELDAASPLYSSIVLAQAAGGTQEDGFLEAWEIMMLDLAAELAVLPDCQTARGQFARESVIGISWALFIAGCPTVVLGQWSLQAGSTSRLMVGFYRRLQTQPVAVALRQAALEMRRSDRFGHPFHWAGLITVGAAR